MKFTNIHTHSNSEKDGVLEIVNQYPNSFEQINGFFSIGIHPWYINAEIWKEELVIMEEKLQLENCLAIGECGLDKRRETSMELQTEIFEAQLLLAQNYQMPVVIHCVGAFQEVIALKKKLNITIPMVIHGFSKSKELAEQLVKEGFYISFGKYLIKNPDLKYAFEIMPDNRIFLETDTMEESIEEVYALAAKYKNLDVVSLQEIVNKNFKTVFKNGRVD